MTCKNTDLSLHLPFCLFISKNTRNECAQDGSLQPQKIQNLDFVNLKCVTYTQLTWVPLRRYKLSEGFFFPHIKKLCLRSFFKFKGVNFKKEIIRDISKLALLCSYAIWNSRKEAIWDNVSCLNINGA